MKDGIHPKYAPATIKCACGAEYRVGSTARDNHIGICAACHPFFTGKQKYVDAAGRVEKFKKRYTKTATVA
jgi:large subunit ribosomal protein L31